MAVLPLPILPPALFTVFGSLYLDEVTLEPRDIISTLATATVFQLDGLIERCAEVMIESMNAEVSDHFDLGLLSILCS